VGRVDRWGRPVFAYEVNHRNEGYYVLIETTAEPTVVAELDRMLASQMKCIRHKVIRVPEKVADGPPVRLLPTRRPRRSEARNGA